MDYKFQRKKIDKIPASKIMDELEKVAIHFNYVEFKKTDFNKIAQISASTVKRHFKSWRDALNALKQHLQQKGLNLSMSHSFRQGYTNKDLFNEMERIWKKCGQRPSVDEWENSNPKISYSCYIRRFNSWTKACLKFIEHKMSAEILVDDFIPPNPEKEKTQINNEIEYKQENSRSISLKIRLAVLYRDNFRCVFCGKSPATDTGTKLHIDHIKPFSKGGNSTLENLQTLCQECNLGKSDNDKIGLYLIEVS